MDVGKLNTGSHLPAYVFLEQFVAGKRVLDIYPPDPRGTTFIRKNARLVVSLVPGGAQSSFGEEKPGHFICGSPLEMPLAAGSFDVVFFFAQNEIARLGSISDILKSARGLVGQRGMVCVVIPNRDSRGLHGRGESDVPRYFDFERSLRRNFPHVTMVGMSPLHGATLCAVGRGNQDIAPLLDDRLIPAGTEAPSHFIGVCSPRYLRVDDSMIIRAPYEYLFVPVRERIDRFRSNLSIAMSESEMRARELEKLEVQIERLKEEVERAELIKHEKASVEGLLKDAERQIETRNRVQLEVTRTNEELTQRMAGIEQNLFDAEQRARREEQRRIEAENKFGLSNREIEDAAAERDKLVGALRDAKAENRARQRELDDVREALAGAEADLSALQGEVARQRKETFSARERATKLSLELQDYSESRSETESLEAELERVRSVAATDRGRLEQRLEEEHKRLLEEMEVQAQIDKRFLGLQKENELLKAKEAEVAQKADILGERLQRVTTRLEAHEKGHRGAQKARDEIEQLARERGDQLERYEHQLEILTSRASQSEERAGELSKQVTELNDGLESAEAELRDLRAFKAKARESATDHQTGMAQFQSELNAESEKNRALRESVTRLETELSKAKARHIEIENAKDLQEKLRREAEQNTRLVEELAGVKSALGYEKERVRAESKRAGEAEYRESKAMDRIVEFEDELDKTRDRVALCEEEITRYKTELEESGRHIIQLERELFEAEEDIKEAARVSEEKLEDRQTELLKVSADVEKELRTAAARLENAQQEVWELNEEIVRLSAQAAAAEAAEEHEEREVETALEQTVNKQEIMIRNLKRERDTLRKSYEKLQQVVKKKRKEKEKKDAESKAAKSKEGKQKQGRAKGELGAKRRVENKGDGKGKKPIRD